MSAATHGEDNQSAAFRTFVWRRMGTILALAPLGVWVILHVWSNLAAYRGAQAWEQSVTHQSSPIAALITWTIVLLPLVIHTLWGIGRIRQMQPNNGAYGYFSNLRYLLQRLSAIGVLLFIGAHLWLAFLHPRLVEGHPERFADIAREMHHHMPTLVVYLLGTLGVSYHLANGIATSAMAFGVGTTQTSQKRMVNLALVLFVVFLVLCWSAIFGLYQAGA